MTTKLPAVVLGRGRRLSVGVPGSGELPTSEQLAAVSAGGIPVTIEAFVEFDAG